LDAIFACIFREFAQIFIDFVQISSHFADIQELYPDFHHIKTFGGALALPPPTPLYIGKQTVTARNKSTNLN